MENTVKYFKVINRRGCNVIRVNFELTAGLMERLDKYCTDYKRSKRDVISEALMMWLNKRETGEWE